MFTCMESIRELMNVFVQNGLKQIFVLLIIKVSLNAYHI